MSDEYMENITQNHMDQAAAVDARRTEIANIYYDNVRKLPAYTKSRMSFRMLRDVLRYMVYPAVFGEDVKPYTACRCNAVEPLPVCENFEMQPMNNNFNADKCLECGHAVGCHGNP